MGRVAQSSLATLGLLTPAATGRDRITPLDDGAPSETGSHLGCTRMPWLIHPDLTATGQAKAGEPSPTLLGDVLGELNAPVAKLLHRGFHVVAHEVQLVARRPVGGVHGQLRGWEVEDQPPTAGVHVGLLENVREKGTVSFRIAAEHDDVASVDHTRTLRAGASTCRGTRVRVIQGQPRQRRGLACCVGLVTTSHGARPRRRGVGSAAR